MVDGFVQRAAQHPQLPAHLGDRTSFIQQLLRLSQPLRGQPVPNCLAGGLKNSLAPPCR